jgi:hypothetical protein
MRTAVCIHGLSRGSSEPSAGAYREKFKTLLNKIKDCTIFIHTWDVDIEEELNSIFKPTLSIFEQQHNFSNELLFFNRYDIKSKTPGMKQGEIFKTLSFLYSRMKSIELKKKYEQENNIIFDCVLTTRFDVGHVNGGTNKTSHLNFDRTLDMNKIYQSNWNQTNAGSSDHWYYSNSKNLDIIGRLYNELKNYLTPNSEYTKWCKEGWPISNQNDEFSDEIFKKERCKNLRVMVNDNTILVNNHALYKYHFIKNNMWEERSIFL